MKCKRPVRALLNDAYDADTIAEARRCLDQARARLFAKWLTDKRRVRTKTWVRLLTEIHQFEREIIETISPTLDEFVEGLTIIESDGEIDDDPSQV